jgi:hypothetical protein
MNTARKICESDAEGIVHVDVPVGRPGQRVEVLVVWSDATEPREATGEHADRRAQLQRYTTWTDADLHEFEVGLAAQREIDAKLWT